MNFKYKKQLIGLILVLLIFSSKTYAAFVTYEISESFTNDAISTTIHPTFAGEFQFDNSTSLITSVTGTFYDPFAGVHLNIDSTTTTLSTNLNSGGWYNGVSAATLTYLPFFYPGSNTDYLWYLNLGVNANDPTAPISHAAMFNLNSVYISERSWATSFGVASQSDQMITQSGNQASIPEPATLLLMITGVAGLAACRMGGHPEPKPSL